MIVHKQIEELDKKILAEFNLWLSEYEQNKGEIEHLKGMAFCTDMQAMCVIDAMYRAKDIIGLTELTIAISTIAENSMKRVGLA